MAIGLVGSKRGMTRIFLEDGQSIPVSVIEVEPNKITQLKTLDTDGYTSVQVTKGSKKASRVNKALTGHYAKAQVEPGEGLWEFRMDTLPDEYKPGHLLTVSLFNGIQKVDISGTSKGKGYAGTVKRHNFATQDASHGNSLSHRAPGSIGQNQSPGRVFKGKKMSGQLGNVKTTVQSLDVVRIDEDKNLILVKGAIPGANGGNVIITPAVKAKHGNQEEAK